MSQPGVYGVLLALAIGFSTRTLAYVSGFEMHEDGKAWGIEQIFEKT